MIDFGNPPPCALPDTRSKVQRSADAEAKTKRLLIEAGHTPAWTEWRGSSKPHKVICKAGHECWPRIDSIWSGNGPCKFCKSATAEANIKRLLIEAGHTPAWTEWLGTMKPHKVICKESHECWPTPGNIQAGHSPCKICAGIDPATAEANVKRLLIEAGHTPAWTKWLGNNTPSKVICKEGHECWPRPGHIQQGDGPCIICAGQDPATAEAKVKRLLIQAGHTPAWTKWLGNNAPLRVTCKEGHKCWPRPKSIVEGNGPCIICAGCNPATAEANVKRLLIEAGHTPAWTHWLGALKPHKVICKSGHECWPRPTWITQGVGPCGKCIIDHDVFYVTVNDIDHELKLGVSSHDERPRLGVHKRVGFNRLVYLLLSVDAAPIEKAILKALPLAGFQPVRRREYFALDALPTILELAGSFGYLNEVEAA